MFVAWKVQRRYKTFARMDRLTKPKLPCFRESQPLLLQKQTFFFHWVMEANCTEQPQKS